MRQVRRRQLLLAAGALLVAPLAADAQQPAKAWRIGFLAVRSRSTPSKPDVLYDTFVQGMRELGYVEGKNLVIEWRFADGKYERVSGLASELVKLAVDVIVSDNTPTTQALQRATGTIPIVFINASDPVESGLVASLARPGRNITGLSNISREVSPKQIELLKELIPALARVAVLVNPGNSTHPSFVTNYQAAGQRLGIKILPVDARAAEEFERGFALMTREHAQAVIVVADAYFLGQRARIATLALTYRMPSMSSFPDDVLGGYLMSYGANRATHYRHAATYVAKILKGAKPNELPVEQPTQLELVINKKTANAFGITIPPSLLLRADRVIE